MAKKQSDAEVLANVNAAQLAAQVANWAAQLEFSKERMRLLELPQFQEMSQLDRDKLAFQKAQDAWQRAIQEATVTGTYNGVPTQAWLEQQAKITGVLNGQQTLEGKLTDAQIAQMNHAMTVDSQRLVLENEKFDFEKQQYGQDFAYKQQQDRIANQFKEADITGTYNGQDTLAKQQLNASSAQSYLQLMSSLQGNPFKQLRVLGNTPGGLRDLVAAWGGKYQMGGLTGSGLTPGAPQLSDLYDPNAYADATIPNGQPVAAAPMVAVPVPVGAAGASGAVGAMGTVQGAEAPAGETGYTISPPGTQAPIGAYNYQGTPSGQTQVYPPGVVAPAGQPQVSTTTPVPMHQATQMAGAASGVLQPNQINAENFANTNKAGQDLMWQWFEDGQGWSPGAAKDAFMKSLPRYAGPQRGTVNAGLGF